MRIFNLIRTEDVSGVSGTGIVAEGAEFNDGTCAMRWKTGTASTAVYASLADVNTIHGHNGATQIEIVTTIDDERHLAVTPSTGAGSLLDHQVSDESRSQVQEFLDWLPKDARTVLLAPNRWAEFLDYCHSQADGLDFRFSEETESVPEYDTIRIGDVTFVCNPELAWDTIQVSDGKLEDVL